MTYGMGSVFIANANDYCHMLFTRRGSLSALLLLSVTVLALTPMAGSQSLTTITSLTTTTRQSTSTSYSTTAVTTATLTSTVNETVFSQTTFTVKAAEPRRCYTYHFTYDALAGERLQGRWTSNYVLNFYVMSKSNYAEYKYCARPGPTFLKATMARSYSLNWVVPENGTLYFVFENYATGSMLSEARTVSFEMYALGPQSSTSVQYSTASAVSVLVSTVTLSSVYYSTVQSPTEGITSSTTLLVIGLVVGILIVIAILIVAKRQKRTVGPKTEKPTNVGKEKRFCTNCGAELPPGSKFCNKCGSTQN
jgi:hypothetical protein